MKTHNLKILKEYYEQQILGVKNFELRKLDRPFTVGDVIKLHEIDRAEKLGDYKPTGRACLIRITSILSGFKGIEDGYGILGTAMIKQL